jgi:hypothetical protein
MSVPSETKINLLLQGWPLGMVSATSRLNQKGYSIQLLNRYKIAAEELNRQCTGMKLTDTPATYKDYAVDSEGYCIYQKRNFIKGTKELWPSAFI